MDTKTRGARKIQQTANKVRAIATSLKVLNFIGWERAFGVDQVPHAFYSDVFFGRVVRVVDLSHVLREPGEILRSSPGSDWLWRITGLSRPTGGYGLPRSIFCIHSASQTPPDSG
jgi:hypothetical protein